MDQLTELIWFYAYHYQCQLLNTFLCTHRKHHNTLLYITGLWTESINSYWQGERECVHIIIMIIQITTINYWWTFSGIFDCFEFFGQERNKNEIQYKHKSIDLNCLQCSAEILVGLFSKKFASSLNMSRRQKINKIWNELSDLCSLYARLGAKYTFFLHRRYRISFCVILLVLFMILHELTQIKCEQWRAQLTTVYSLYC